VKIRFGLGLDADTGPDMLSAVVDQLEAAGVDSLCSRPRRHVTVGKSFRPRRRGAAMCHVIVGGPSLECRLTRASDDERG
jgi:hypothetical protein